MKQNYFTSEQHSTFSYWFAHWCAFNMTALNLHCWKVKYLFHDIEKPWMRLFMSHKQVQKWHRLHNKHHVEYGIKNGFNKVDWEAAIIDWECSRFTKLSSPLNSKQFIEKKINTSNIELVNALKEYAIPTLAKIGLDD